MREFSATVLIAALTWLVGEGIYAVVKWDDPSTSITAGAVKTIGRALKAPPSADPEAFPGVLVQASELERMFPLMLEAGVGLGNTPYGTLKTDKSEINYRRGGCKSLKPNLRKVTFFLNTQLFDRLEPVTAFHDADAQLDPQLEAFLDRYAASPRASLTSNAVGERSTIPLLERPRKVIIAGDSVAFGAMLDDRDTIASQLQRRDDTRQYISTGVAGAEAADVICNLEGAGERYSGQIDELIYVYCENDFDSRSPLGRPAEVVDRLVEFASRQRISRVTVVYAPYVYNIAPQLTRFAGYRGDRRSTDLAERRALKEAVENAGFRWLDIGELALEDNARFGTQFAFWHFFLDHVHPSPYGVERLVDRLALP